MLSEISNANVKEIMGLYLSFQRKIKLLVATERIIVFSGIISVNATGALVRVRQV